MHMNFMQSMLAPDELSKYVCIYTPAITAAAAVAASSGPSRLTRHAHHSSITITSSEFAPAPLPPLPPPPPPTPPVSSFAPPILALFDPLASLARDELVPEIAPFLELSPSTSKSDELPSSGSGSESLARSIGREDDPPPPPRPPFVCACRRRVPASCVGTTDDDPGREMGLGRGAEVRGGTGAEAAGAAMAGVLGRAYCRVHCLAVSSCFCRLRLYS